MLPDGAGGCSQPGGGVAMTSDGTAIYVDVESQDSEYSRVYGIARVTRGIDGWAAQTPELFLRDDNYYEAHVLSLFENSQSLDFGYLAGFQQGGVRDDRVIILDTSSTGANCAC